ncbi:hypothetical protein [Staphylococcus phage vB_ScaM-V1SC04]|nr:hypothetical protein [Staphylococcus phage vB_ScaM-V1SC04]
MLVTLSIVFFNFFLFFLSVFFLNLTTIYYHVF